jgi:hypothetical protein
MTDTAAATQFLAAAALAADLEDWGPLEEATGEPMQTTGKTLWAGGEQEVGVWGAPLARPAGRWKRTRRCTSCPAG